MPESVNEVLSRIPEKSEWARLRRSASLVSLNRVGAPFPHPVPNPRLFTGPGRRPGSTPRPFTGPGRRPGSTPRRLHWTGSETRFHIRFHISTFHRTGSETRFHTRFHNATSLGAGLGLFETKECVDILADGRGAFHVGEVSAVFQCDQAGLRNRVCDVLGRGGGDEVVVTMDD